MFIGSKLFSEVRSPVLLLLPIILLLVIQRSLEEKMVVSCPGSDYTELIVHRKVSPYGNTSAGEFTKVNDASQLLDCTKDCCKKDNCDVVFFFNFTCFHITCHESYLCDPLPRTSEKFEQSYMVRIRSSDGHLKKDKPRWNDHFEDFKPDEYPFEFYLRDAPSHVNIEDKDDLNESALDQSTAESHLYSSAFTAPVSKVKNCVYGIVGDCPENEHCKTKNNRARQGICYCNSNFVRDASEKCVPKKSTESSVTKMASLASTSHLPTGTGSTNELSPTVKNSTLDSKVSPSSTPSSLHHLVVSAGDNVVIQLPENEVTLSAYALPAMPKEGESYKFEWKLLSHPDGDETGTMQDQNTATLKLSKLRAGLYTFEVTVTGDGASGEAFVNVTVLPPKRNNKPPVAIIQPSNVTVKLPNKDTVLDGSFSTDDDKIVKYHWEVLEVPIGYAIQLNDTPTLQLKNLIPGFFRFKLTVIDSDGISNSTYANVTVQKEMDYPPTANADSEVVIHLPKTEVVLNGNLSTDDKGIKSWEWTKSADTDKAVDMEGTNSPYLHLSQLEVGVYKFILKVTDTADQTSTTEVHVFVKPESNSPPSANAGPDQHITLPLEGPVLLNGNQSKDDIRISRWHWEQVKGPKQSKLEDDDKSVAKVLGLVPGEYEFKLTVFDEKGGQNSDSVAIFVTQTQNLPPHANAGGDKTVHLPCDVIVMNGSLSSDDVGIESFYWTRDPSSLVAGDIIEKSDHAPALKLTNLIPGRYLFKLTVTDSQGVSSSDTASLIVKPPASIMDQVEIMVNADIKSFTQEQQDSFLRQLELLLHDGEPVKVHLQKLDSDRHSHRVIIILLVEKVSGNTQKSRVPGVEVVSRLKKKLHTDSSLLDFEVLSLDTVVCQNRCSGHGSCDQYTKRCVCEAFWMENMFRSHLGDEESNCDWSILYVIIVSFTIVTALAGIFWGIVCCCTRMRFRKPKKRHRYTLLEEFSDREKEKHNLLPRSKPQKSSLMMSESESETVFDTRLPVSVKTSNGYSNLNGLVKDVHKVTA